MLVWLAALGEIDPAAHNFKVLVRHVVSRIMDSIPAGLLDKELGMDSVPSQVEEIHSDGQQAEDAQQDGQPSEAEQVSEPKQAQHAHQDSQQAKQAGHDGDFEEEEEGRVRLPLFTNKVMALVQDLLKYKVSHVICFPPCLSVASRGVIQ